MKKSIESIENNMSGAELMQLKRIERQEENGNHVVGLKKVIDVTKAFITEDNPKGFFRPDKFINNILAVPQYHENDFKVLFEAVSNNEKLEKKSSYQYTVKGTNFNAFELVYGPHNFRENFKLILIDGMEDFLKAVKSNAFIFQLSYDELIKKAHELTSIK